jgi:hypothetical protein
VAAEDGAGDGFDILSVEPTGREALIEVKTTTGGARTPFFLTRTERDVSEEQPEAWRLYRVHEFNRTPRIFTIQLWLCERGIGAVFPPRRQRGKCRRDRPVSYDRVRYTGSNVHRALARMVDGMPFAGHGL